MRPSAGGDALAGRSRKSSLADAITPLAGPGHGTQTTFFLANEDMMKDSNTEPDKDGRDSVYGVESLEETMCAAEDGDELEEDDEEDGEGDGAGGRRSTLRGKTDMKPIGTSTETEDSPVPDSVASPFQPRPRRPSPSAVSQPLTPLSLQSPVPSASLPSSPKSTSTRSLRHSDEDSMQDDACSQAVVSSGDEDAESPQEMQDSAPQLIMPSIKMPSRRPFTDRGKDIGRLKVLIAGDSGKFPDIQRARRSYIDDAQALVKRPLSNLSFNYAKTLYMLTRCRPALPLYRRLSHRVILANSKLQTLLSLGRLPKFMRVPNHIHLGGQSSKKARYSRDGRVWETPCWRGICVSWIRLGTVVVCP